MPVASKQRFLRCGDRALSARSVIVVRAPAFVLMQQFAPGRNAECAFRAAKIPICVREAEATRRLGKKILSRIPGVELVEPEYWKRDNGLCCGAGGAQMWMKSRVTPELLPDALGQRHIPARRERDAAHVSIRGRRGAPRELAG